MELISIIVLNVVCIILVGVIMFSPIFIYILIQQKTRIENLENDRRKEQKKSKEWMIIALNYKATIQKMQQLITLYNITFEADKNSSIQELQARDFELLNIEELNQLMNYYTEIEDYTFASICRDRIKFLEQTK